jgi:8-oxo-dGTP pyrophosphatase MutT (NUDIX family)
MVVRFCCGSTRYDVVGEPVCGHVWDAPVVVSDWVAEEASSPCPECGSYALQCEGHASVVDYGLPLAVVLCVREGDEVLAVSRRDDPAAFGLVGGKVDPEDGPVDPEHLMATLRRALVREVREEIGVELDPDDLWFEFQLPDPSGYWNVCFGAPAHLLRGASTQEGEGVVAWVGWPTLESGPFGAYNRALHSHIWESERWPDLPCSDEQE